MAREDKSIFPVLGDWRGTRETLHAYCKVLSAIRAAFTAEQPRHAHLGLRLYTSGLTTTPITNPSDPATSFALSLDLRNHYVLLSTSVGEVQQIRMSEGLSATQLGDELIARMEELGISGKVGKGYQNDYQREYALVEAERFFAALNRAAQVFEQFRAQLGVESNPVQLWPRQFDLAFAAFDGGRQVTTGFAPGDGSGEYFYVSAEPFDRAQTARALPQGARWHTDGWNGAMLPYVEVAGKPDGGERLLGFLQAATNSQP